jgi:predicted transcriptional regulator
MARSRGYGRRDEREVAVLDALVDWREEGLTVFELRATADVSIDELEEALRNLKDDDLITVEENGDRTVIRPADSITPMEDEERSVLDRLRDRLPF